MHQKKGDPHKILACTPPVNPSTTPFSCIPQLIVVVHPTSGQQSALPWLSLQTGHSCSAKRWFGWLSQELLKGSSGELLPQKQSNCVPVQLFMHFLFVQPWWRLSHFTSWLLVCHLYSKTFNQATLTCVLCHVSWHSNQKSKHIPKKNANMIEKMV